MIKPEFVIGDEKRVYEFLSRLTERDKVAIISHTDLDGIASAVMAEKIIGKADFIYFLSYRDEEARELVLKLKKLKINKIIVLDCVFDNFDINMKELEKLAEILIIDHHPVYKDLNSPRTVMIKAESSFPAAYLAYYLLSKIQEIPIWVVSLGVLGDTPHIYHKEEKVPKMFDDFQLEKPENFESFCKTLFKYVEEIALALVYLRQKEQGIKEIYEFVSKAKNLSDIGSVEKYAKPVREELEKLQGDYKKNKEEYGSLIYYSYKSRYSINSLLATSISISNPKKTLVFVEDKGGDILAIGARRQDKDVNVGELLREAVKNIPDSKAGGHPGAAGANFPRKYLVEFKENLIKIHSQLKFY